MLNGGGMGTPDGGYGGGGPGSSPSEYPPAPNSNPSSMSNFHPHNPHGHPHFPQHPHHRDHPGGPPMGNGMMGHHSGGICSQMGLNQGGCPQQDTKMRSCGGCGDPILDRILFEAWDRFWHHGCLKCSMCNSNLADMGPTCFSRDGMMLCKSDYLKMFGMKRSCRGCGQIIPSNEFVMRAGLSPLGESTMVFHVHCFNCSKCGKVLSTGDRYSIMNGALLCEPDALKVMKQNGIGSPAANAATNGPTTAPRKGKVGRPRRSRD